MDQIYKPGKVAVVLSGRQAGKKVVVIQQRDEGTKERPYPHAIVAGIERLVKRGSRAGQAGRGAEEWGETCGRERLEGMETSCPAL